MFEIKISSTKDVKKIVIEFGDEPTSDYESSINEIETSNNSKSLTDVLSSRLDTSSSKKKEKITKINEVVSNDIEERPPFIDDTFAESEF